MSLAKRIRLEYLAALHDHFMNMLNRKRHKQILWQYQAALQKVKRKKKIYIQKYEYETTLHSYQITHSVSTVYMKKQGVSDKAKTML
jgi:hypothetical protein